METLTRKMVTETTMETMDMVISKEISMETSTNLDTHQTIILIEKLRLT